MKEREQGNRLGANSKTCALDLRRAAIAVNSATDLDASDFSDRSEMSAPRSTQLNLCDSKSVATATKTRSRLSSLSLHHTEQQATRARARDGPSRAGQSWMRAFCSVW
jgi:hypothetical protein